jgi:hypothetical protein
MKTFAELKEYLSESASTKKYKGVSYRISKLGSMNTLYVDDEKIDVFRSEAEADKAAKEFIDLSK